MPDRIDAPKLGLRFDAALADAADWHRFQRRKGTDIPYVSHLLAVCALVLEDGGGEDEAIAALLHDAVEDAPEGKSHERRERIIGRYGRDVLEIVDACSDTDVTPKPPWRERKEAHLRHLREHATPGICRVVAADKLHNARALVADYKRQGEALWSKFNATRDETLWYYDSMIEVLAAAGTGHLADELTTTVAELHRLTTRAHQSAPTADRRLFP